MAAAVAAEDTAIAMAVAAVIERAPFFMGVGVKDFSPGQMKLTLVSLLSAILLAGCASTPSASTRDAKLLGEWNCVSATIDGKPLPADTVKALHLVITDTRYITEKGNETLFDSTYRVDRTTSPAQIFMLGNEGALTGKEAHGIYEISGDTLWICYTMPGDPAPTAFQSAVGSKAYLIHWRRGKP